MQTLFRQWPHSRCLLRDPSRLSRVIRLQSSTTPPASPATKVAKLESRLPKVLRHFVAPLRNAPVSHITAFVILHELTAIVPLFGLAAAFHYSNWLPPIISEGKWVSEGIEKYGKWLRKKGWINDENFQGRWYGRGETGVRIVIELGTAYAITKAMLPFRLVISVWATPWFARWTVLPITNRLGRIFKRSKGSPANGSPASGTGAVGSGTLPKNSK